MSFHAEVAVKNEALPRRRNPHRDRTSPRATTSMDQNGILANNIFSSGSYFPDRPAALDFIENRLQAYHPAFRSPPSHFDVRSKLYTLPPLENTMQQNAIPTVSGSRALALMPFWNEIFPRAMAQFQRQATEPRIVQGSSYGIRNKSNWDGVEQQLQSAQDIYLHASGMRGRIRQIRRTAADHSQSAVQTSRLVPNVDMISPVVTIVQNLLEAVRYAAKVRQDIQLGFGSLEETFSEIDFVFNTFPKDLNVKKAGTDLVAAMLDAVEKAIAFYLKPLLRKMGSAVFQGEEYESKITQSLETVKMKSEALVHQGRNSHVYSSRKEAEGSRKRDVELIGVARSTNTTVETVENKVVEIADSVEAVNKRLDLFDEMFALLYQAEKAKVTQNQPNGVLITHQAVRPTTPLSAMNPHSQQSMYAQKERSISPAVLWSYLEMPEIEKEDMKYCDARRESISVVDRGRTERIVSVERFRDWLISPRSSPFLVLGECDSVAHMTAFTLFCSTLTQAFREKQNFISLAFFCEQHREEDQRSGGVVLIRSFIAQLLCQYPFITGNIHQEVDLESVWRQESAGLCRLLSWLIRQLSEAITLVCVVDGLGYYERSAVVEETFDVMAHISHMMQNPGLKATVKVLATSSVPVRVMRQFFPESSVLNLSTLSSFDGPSRLRMQRQLHDGGGDRS